MDLGYAHDTADRPTTARTGTITAAGTTTTLPTGAYTYDQLGRQTTIPAADTPAYTPGSAVGAIAVGYFDDDLPRSVSQGSTSTTFTLDSAGRRLTATTTTGSGSSTLTRHYTDGSDNPAWTDQDGTITRYAESIGGDLGTTINPDGSADLTLANLHGDVVTTVPIAATATSADPAAGIDGWSDYLEYGTPRNPTATTAVAGAAGYGWLGAKQRSTTTETAGLTLMGDRLYNAVTGRFTSLDPQPGGNPTAYTYPLDPINMYDLDGHWGWFKRAARWGSGNSRSARIFRGACGWAPGWAGVACGSYITASYAYRGDRRQALRWGAQTAASLVGGGLVAKGFRSRHAFGSRATGHRYRGRHGAYRWRHRAAYRMTRSFTRRNAGYRSAVYWSSHLHGSAASSGVGAYGQRRRWWR